MRGSGRGWLRAPDAQRAGPQRSFVSVLSPVSHAVVGAGSYLGDGRVLTCAHVVNDALGRDMFAQEAPGTGAVLLAFPNLDGGAEVFAARAVAWVPARQTDGAAAARAGDRTWTGDLTLLELGEAPPPGLRPLRWMPMTEGQDVRAWYGNGMAFTYAEGAVRLRDGTLAYVDSDLRGASIGPGYSGGPLWCEGEQAAVGVVVGVVEPPPGGFAAAQVIRRTLTLPWQTVETELARAVGPGARAGAGPASGAGPLSDAGSLSDSGSLSGTGPLSGAGTFPDAARPGAGHPGAAHSGAAGARAARAPLRPVDPAARHALASVVAMALGDPGERAAQAARLAEELGLPAVPDVVPSVDEVVEVLVTERRALAVLSEGLTKTAPDTALRLLSLGRAALLPGILSVRELRWLCDLLPPDAATRLPVAAREALPDSTLFEPDPAGPAPDLSYDTSPYDTPPYDTSATPHPPQAHGHPDPDPDRAADGSRAGPAVEAFIEELEEFWGDSAPVPEGTPRVPALLRSVEYLAATRGPRAARELHDWCETVAQRLGVAQAALLERRHDAAGWYRRSKARTAVPRPRLVVRLTRGPGGRFRTTCWYSSGREDDEIERQVFSDDEPRTPEAVTRLLHDLLVRETATAGRTEPPAIEVLLDPDDLDEPVERWDNGAGTYELPVVLGAEYAVVVRCPALRARAEHARDWRARWDQLDRGGLLRLDHRHSTALQVYGLLKADLGVARVLMGCDPRHRAALRATCLTLGVPVVMWDRDSPAHAPSDQLAVLMLNGPVRELPSRVREHRARTLGDPGTHAGMPGLIWDDATRLPPTARWADPTGEEPLA